MYTKPVRDLVLTTTTYTDAYPLGSDNAVVLEGWLVYSSVGSPEVKFDIQGSNDRLNWSRVDGLSTPLLLNTPQPQYGTNTSKQPIPYDYVRVKLSLTSGHALVDAAFRTFKISS